MRPILLILAAAALLSGCSSAHTLAECKGPLVAMNANRWQPTTEQMTALAAACPEGS